MCLYPNHSWTRVDHLRHMRLSPESHSPHSHETLFRWFVLMGESNRSAGYYLHQSLQPFVPRNPELRWLYCLSRLALQLIVHSVRHSSSRHSEPEPGVRSHIGHKCTRHTQSLLKMKVHTLCWRALNGRRGYVYVQFARLTTVCSVHLKKYLLRDQGTISSTELTVHTELCESNSTLISDWLTIAVINNERCKSNCLALSSSRAYSPSYSWHHKLAPASGSPLLLEPLGYKNATVTLLE